MNDFVVEMLLPEIDTYVAGRMMFNKFSAMKKRSRKISREVRLSISEGIRSGISVDINENSRFKDSITEENEEAAEVPKISKSKGNP